MSEIKEEKMSFSVTWGKSEHFMVEQTLVGVRFVISSISINFIPEQINFIMFRNN